MEYKCDYCLDCGKVRLRNVVTIVERSGFRVEYGNKAADAIYCPMCGRKIKTEEPT